MKVKGSISFGSVTVAGAILCDITTEDGQKYHFKGGMGGLGTTVSVGVTIPIEGNFSGLSHILGSCAVEILTAGTVLGAIQITFFDLQGQIGTALGMGIGGGVFFGVGGGTWEKA
jgi:hypothetical protein